MKAWRRALLMAASSGNAPQFRNAATASTAAAGTSLQVAVPAGVKDGDVLLFGIAIRGGSNVTNLDVANWAPLFVTNQSTNVQTAVFFRVASSEPANYTATWTGSFNAAAAIYAAYNAATASPTNGNQANTSSLNVTAPSINAGTGPVLLVFAGGMSAGATFTPPPTMANRERADVKSTAGATNAAFTFADEVSAGGATGTRVAVSDSAGGNVGGLIAFALP